MPHVDGDDDGVGYGVYGSSIGNGVCGESETKAAVLGISPNKFGVVGLSTRGTGLYGVSTSYYAAILRESENNR